jgi:hypothetical protein
MAIPPQDDNAPIHTVWVVTEWFDENEKDVNHGRLSHQISTQLNTIDFGGAPFPLLSSSKHQMHEFLMKEWYYVTPIVPDTCIIFAKVHRSCSGSW